MQPSMCKSLAGVLALMLVAPGGVMSSDVTARRDRGVAHLPADAARMYGFVKSPHPGELKWQQIPWLTDLRVAIRQAKAEHRPVLLFVSGDEPLEKC